MKIKSNPLFIIILLIVVYAIAFYFGKQYSDANNGFKIKVSGNIEATEVKISFRVPGQINDLFAEEGDKVKKGQLIAKLNTDELEKISLQAQSSYMASESKHKFMKLEYARMENLFREGAISQQKRDAALTNNDASRLNVEALKSAWELADTRLGFAEILSPIEGFIITKSAEPGEFVQPGSVIYTIADLSDIWLTAYINETDLGKVKLNQDAKILIDTFPDKRYDGKISYISQEAEFTPKQIQTTEERVKLVYRIKIKINNDNLELKPGMPADGIISDK